MMRLGPALFLLAALAGPLRAQDLMELPQGQPLPPGIQATLVGAIAADEILDLVRMWQGDLMGDAAPDLLVQAAIVSSAGGNSFYLRQWIFENRGQVFAPVQELDLPEGIKSAQRDGPRLIVQVYKSLPDDPRCCPSGQEQVVLPLN